MPHDVFLSYSRDDTEFMQRLRDDLRQAGIVVWTDEAIEPGSPSWKSDIEQAIRNTRCLVVLLSPDAALSKWVRAEIDFAESLQKPMYTLLVRGDETNAVPFGLTTHQRIEMRSPQHYASGLQMLTRAIASQSNMPVTGANQTAAAKPTTTSRRRIPVRLAVLLGALLVLLIVAGIWLIQRGTGTVALSTPVEGSEGQWVTQRADNLLISVPRHWTLGMSGPPMPESLKLIYTIIDEAAPNPKAAEAFKATFPPEGWKLIFGNLGALRSGTVYEQPSPFAIGLDITRQLALSQWESIGVTITEDDIVSLPAGDMLRVQGHAQTASIPAEIVSYFLPAENKVYIVSFLISSTDTVNRDLPPIMREIDAMMQTFTVETPAS